jgi:hypothetical protein
MLDRSACAVFSPGKPHEMPWLIRPLQEIEGSPLRSHTVCGTAKPVPFVQCVFSAACLALVRMPRGEAWRWSRYRPAPDPSGRTASSVRSQQWVGRCRHRDGLDSDEIPRQRCTGLVRDQPSDKPCVRSWTLVSHMRTRFPSSLFVNNSGL